MFNNNISDCLIIIGLISLKTWFYNQQQKSKKLILYSSWFCPYAQRIQIALNIKNIQYEIFEINPYQQFDDKTTKIALSLTEKQIKYPQFIKASPRGLVPALVNSEDKVCDSMVIMEYLEEKFGQSLLPSDPGQRANVRFWANFTNEKIIPFYYRMLMSTDQEGRENAKKSILEGFQTLQDNMDTVGPYFTGKTMGYMDIVLAPWWQRILSVSKYYRNFEVPKSYERLHKWYSAILQQESFKKTLVDENQLINNYSGYADNSATSNVAVQYRQ